MKFIGSRSTDIREHPYSIDFLCHGVLLASLFQTNKGQILVAKINTQDTTHRRWLDAIVDAWSNRGPTIRITNVRFPAEAYEIKPNKNADLTFLKGLVE